MERVHYYTLGIVALSAVVVSGIVNQNVEEALQPKPERVLKVETSHGAVEPESQPYARQEVIRAGDGGHFIVRTTVDGRSLEMMADTGATTVALTYEDAQRLGLGPSRLTYDKPVNTANGHVLVAPVKLQNITVGSISVRDVTAHVVPQGKLHISLLGQAFLGRLSSFSVKDGKLTLVK